jgi:hypothetical protein
MHDKPDAVSHPVVTLATRIAAVPKPGTSKTRDLVDPIATPASLPV